MNLDSRESVEAFRTKYENDPVSFCKDILHLELDANQTKIAEATAKSKRVCAVSARGCGKTVVASALCIWFHATRRNSKVLVIANTAQQSGAIVWTRIKSMLLSSELANLYDVNDEYACISGLRDSSFIKRVIWNRENIESVSGFHAQHLLYYFDEASAMPDKLITNMEASCTETDNRLLMTSNPTRISGYFHDSCDTEEWNTIHVSGYDSKFTDKKFLDGMVEKYGKDSDICRVQVFGLFPKADDSSLFTRSSLFADTERITGNITMGFDVAGAGGDLNAMAIRDGNKLLTLQTFSASNLDDIVSKIQGVVDSFHPSIINVDGTGIGYYVPDSLRVAFPQVTINSVNFAEKGDERTANARAMMYVRLSDAVRTGKFSLDESSDEEREAATELLTMTSSLNSRGRILIRAKEEIRELLGHSPDRSDAIALTYFVRDSDSIQNSSTDKRKLIRRLQIASRWN